MDSDDLNRITKMAFWIGFVINLIIGLYCFQYLPNIGSLEGFFKIHIRIGIISLCALMSGILCLAIRVIFKYSNEIFTWIFSAIVSIVIPFLNYNVCMAIAYTKPLSIEEQMHIMEKEANNDKKQAQKLLSSAILFSPGKGTVLEDQNRLINNIKGLLSSFDELESNYGEMNDSVRLDLINRLLRRNFKILPDTTCFHSIRDSLQCNFISYSPDFKHFIAILTSRQDSPHSDKYCYLGMVLFCEKKGKNIDIYSHTGYQYDWYSREFYKNDIILRYFRNMGRYFLDSETYKKQSSNILRKTQTRLQDEKFLFDTIVIQNKKYLRYQTESTRDYNTNTNRYSDGYSARPVYTIK